jgi:peroxiredoxin
MPWFDELSKKYQVAGLTVLGVSIDSEGWDAVKPFLDKIRITYPIVVATQRVTYLYGDVDTVPLAFFIDRNQRVAAIHLGEASRKEFENTIKVLLAAPVGTGVGRLR